MDAMGVELGLSQIEVVDVPGEGVLLVQGEQPVLQRPLDRGLPGIDQEPGLLVFVQG